MGAHGEDQVTESKVFLRLFHGWDLVEGLIESCLGHSSPNRATVRSQTHFTAFQQVAHSCRRFINIAAYAGDCQNQITQGIGAVREVFVGLFHFLIPGLIKSKLAAAVPLRSLLGLQVFVGRVSSGVCSIGVIINFLRSSTGKREVTTSS